MAEQHLTPQQFQAVAKENAMALERLSLTDHTCLVNILMRLCERRQAIRLEEINANAERQQQEAQGAPHLITKPS
jgi:hypothetical protein